MNYEVDKNDNVYLVLTTYSKQFVGKLNGRTIRQFIEDIQELELKGI